MHLKPHRNPWRANLILALALAFLPCAPARAALVFERASIRIESPPVLDSDVAVKPQHSPLTFDVELRSDEALRLEYIHTLNTLTDTTGIMIEFSTPAVAALPAMSVYTPVDVLFITEDGVVVQILPNVKLGEIKQNLAARMPVKAFLFLKAGTAATRGIHPRDVVFGRMFTPAVLMQE